MKKYLTIILLVFIVFYAGCKEEKPVEEDKPFETKELIEASHEINVDSDEVNPYLVVKGMPADNGKIDYSLIIYLNFPRKYQDKVLEQRFYNYLQCDYYAGNEVTTYFHEFDHGDDDGGHLSNAIKFVPRYNTNEVLNKVRCILKYEYSLNNEINNKEIKFEENILSFDETKFSDEIENDNYHFEMIINKNEEEDFNRYKFNIDLDDNNITGHYDIQIWIKCDGEIIPFLGYYHYRAINGDISTVSDEKISIDRNVDVVYYMVRFFDYSGKETDIYYQKRID